MSGWEFWLLAVIGAVLTGVGKGGIPIVGALVVPVLSLVINPVVAAGLMLPVYVVWTGSGFTPIARDSMPGCRRLPASV